MDNKNVKINFDDVNSWKLPAAMYFNRELKKDSIIACFRFASEAPCCISGVECKVFNSIEAVAGYLKYHILYDNIVYSILKMEYSTTANECDDDIFLIDIQDIWNQNVGAIALLEYVEQSYPDRWDKKLAELKTYVEVTDKTLGEIFKSDDDNEKKKLLRNTMVLFNDFFGDICRWSFEIQIYFGIAEFVKRYEEDYNIPLWLCEEKDVWDEMKSGKFDDECAPMIETLIHAMNA